MKAITGCQPLFDAMGKKTFVVDEKPPTANLIKLSGNVLIMCIIDSLGETFALTRKSGIDPHRFLEILRVRCFPSRFSGRMVGSSPTSNTSLPVSRWPWAWKDTHLALAAADSLLVPMPLASQIHDRMLTVVARGAGDIDW